MHLTEVKALPIGSPFDTDVVISSVVEKPEATTFRMLDDSRDVLEEAFFVIPKEWAKDYFISELSEGDRIHLEGEIGAEGLRALSIKRLH